MRAVAQRAQEDLLEVVLKVFQSKNDWVEKGPSFITDRLNLFKKLRAEGKHEMKGQHAHVLAQGLINELLNRGELEHRKKEQNGKTKGIYRVMKREKGK